MRRFESALRSIRSFWSQVADALFPAVCPVCFAAPEPSAASGRGDLSLGGACSAHALPDPDRPLPGAHCGTCALALPPMLPDGTRCAACRRDRPRYSRVVTLGDYREDDGLREWILALKHGGRRDLAEPLGRALAQRLRGVARGPVLLVPVPLHPFRRLERGYDQAAWLARAVAAADVDRGTIDRALLARVRHTPPQGALGAVSRTANVARAFVPRHGAAADLLGVSVWLVDDVVTSGATVEACATALGRMGARRVSVLCLARAGSAPSRPLL